MALFDMKNFNGEVFGAYVGTVENLSRTELLKSRAIIEKPQYASMLPDQVGGNFITVPIKARITGDPDNYDGGTDIKSDSRATYAHGRIVIGRARGWTEKDFASDITGEDFMPAATEVAEYWDDVDMADLLAVLEGIFSMASGEGANFVTKHTHDVTTSTINVFDSTTLNNAMQKALGDNKAKFALAVMHSQVATNIENLKLTDYLKYTDKEGVQRTISAGTLNGRAVLVTDLCPAVAGDADTTYTTYIFGEGAIEYTNVGAKVPYEMARDAAKNGGETTLYSRQRKIFSPVGISWKNNASIISPTRDQLKAGTNWAIAACDKAGAEKYFPLKAIAIGRVLSKG